MSATLTRDAFLSRMRALGLRQVRFAELAGVSEVTVYQWGKIADVPSWVHPMLTAWEALQAVYGEAWPEALQEQSQP